MGLYFRCLLNGFFLSFIFIVKRENIFTEPLFTPEILHENASEKTNKIKHGKQLIKIKREMYIILTNPQAKECAKRISICRMINNIAQFLSQQA